MKAFIFKISKGYTRDKLRIYSSSVSFYIIVSSVPLVSILFFILSFLAPSLILGLESLISSILPKEIFEGFNSILSSLKERGSVLVPFSIFTAIWGSTKGIGGICEGVEHIYKVQSKGGFFIKGLQRLWRTLLFYLVTLASLLVFALGKLFHPYADQFFIIKIFLKVRIIFFALFLFFFFSLLYWRLSNKSFKQTLLGGAFSSIGWMVFTYFYSIYVSYAINSVSIYAEMGTVIFFMLWVYFCVNIVLIGAEINRILAKK